MIEVVGAVLAASLLGSPHCAGMCGGFVCFYSGQGGGARWYTHLAYNGGRLLSYLGLGIAAGLLGAGFDRLGTGAGWTRPAALAAGILMIVWGGIALLRARGVRIPLPRAHALQRVSRGLFARLQNHPPAIRALLLGLLTTLLPCGCDGGVLAGDRAGARRAGAGLAARLRPAPAASPCDYRGRAHDHRPAHPHRAARPGRAPEPDTRRASP
jgi:sulfite exporter TauE/SafE